MPHAQQKKCGRVCLLNLISTMPHIDVNPRLKSQASNYTFNLTQKKEVFTVNNHVSPHIPAQNAWCRLALEQHTRQKHRKAPVFGASPGFLLAFRRGLPLGGDRGGGLLDAIAKVASSAEWARRNWQPRDRCERGSEK